METKREKFVRLAEKRMNGILKGIDLMKNLSNANNYEYSAEDLSKIVKTLRSAVNDLEYTYRAGGKTEKFTL